MEKKNLGDSVDDDDEGGVRTHKARNAPYESPMVVVVVERSRTVLRRVLVAVAVAIIIMGRTMRVNSSSTTMDCSRLCILYLCDDTDADGL